MSDVMLWFMVVGACLGYAGFAFWMAAVIFGLLGALQKPVPSPESVASALEDASTGISTLSPEMAARASNEVDKVMGYE